MSSSQARYARARHQALRLRPDGVKIHTEDCARILGAVDQQKYFLANQENLVNVTTQNSSDPFGEAFEAIRRFVVDIMVGNGDGHLKSWSFIFPDGNRDRILTFQLFMREREMLLAPSSGQPAAAGTSLVPESQYLAFRIVGL
ncbi:MAG: HipA domain-containing protein [Pseudomonadota bacterium]